MFFGNFFIFIFKTSDPLMHFTFYCFLLQERVGQASNELSGDSDTSEGGFDGLMQAATCEQVKLAFFLRWLSRGYITNRTKYSRMDQVKFVKGSLPQSQICFRNTFVAHSNKVVQALA